MDEFLPEVERERRATQFEKLRQTPRVSVSDYAQEFIKLSKYAQHMVPTEAMKVKRFKAGMVTPLYNTLVAVKFSTLSKLVDTAKQLEARHQEDKEEREQKRQLTGKAQGS